MSDSTTRDSGPAEVLVRHPALVLTVGYLMISLLGLSFEWTLFRQFGINFFYFAEVTDFLMGAFREPVTFLLSAIALLVGADVSVEQGGARVAREKGSRMVVARGLPPLRDIPLQPLRAGDLLRRLFGHVHLAARGKPGDGTARRQNRQCHRPHGRQNGAVAPVTVGDQQPVRHLLQGSRRPDGHRPVGEHRVHQRRRGAGRFVA